MALLIETPRPRLANSDNLVGWESDQLIMVDEREPNIGKSGSTPCKHFPTIQRGSVQLALFPCLRLKRNILLCLRVISYSKEHYIHHNLAHFSVLLFNILLQKCESRKGPSNSPIPPIKIFKNGTYFR